MNESLNEGIDARDQAVLDEALRQSDQYLASSLKQEETRRRRRRWVIIFSTIGGIAMTTLIAVLLSGMMMTATVETAEGGSSAAGVIDVNKKVGVEEMEQAQILAAAGWQLWQQRRYLEAQEQFHAAAVLDPGNADTWNGLGWARFNIGQYKPALQAFEQCLKLSPNHPAGLNGAGQVSYILHEFEAAEKYLLKAASNNAAAAWWGLARLYLMQDEFAKAQKWAKKIVDAQPGDQTAKRMLKAAQAGKLDAALRKEIEPPVKKDNSSQSKQSQRGWQLFMQGKPRPAAAWFRQALEANPDELSAINGLGFSLLNMGMVDQAKPLFERYLQEVPDAAGPMNGLARCLKEEGDVDGAIEVWQRMYELYPGPNAGAVGLATTYLERGEYEQAARYYQVLVKAQPDNGEFQAGLNQAKAAMGKSSDTPLKMSKQVEKLVKMLEENVRKLRAGETDDLVHMSDTFVLINELCDELQGKNDSPAPARSEWGNMSADDYSKIMNALAEIENMAEGMRSAAYSKDVADSERQRMLDIGRNMLINHYEVLKLVLDRQK